MLDGSKIATFVLCAAMCACNGTRSIVSPSSAQRLDYSYARLASIQDGASSSMEELKLLRDEFDSMDDVYGGWLVASEVCRRSMKDQGWPEAAPFCKDAGRRAALTGGRVPQFRSAMQLYFYSEDPSYLRRAQNHASGEQDELILRWVQDRNSTLHLPEEEHEDPDVRAYQYYWYGKIHSDDTALQTAHALYFRNRNSRGIADTLFLRAKLAAARGQAIDARQLASRSKLVLNATGDTRRADRVQVWMDDELAPE
jgi:hypothetical protein